LAVNKRGTVGCGECHVVELVDTAPLESGYGMYNEDEIIGTFWAML
jgi:hypothetical protein